MRSPLNCSAIRAQLGDHLRGQLAPAEALPFEQHISICPSCREALTLERRLWAGAGPRIAAPAGFAATVLAQPHRRPARAGWIGALLRNMATDTVFRALVDPLLRLDLHLRDVWQLITDPLTNAQLSLRAEGLRLCQQLAFPMQQAGRQVRTALAGPTDPQ